MLRPKKQLGQNFLVNESILPTIIKAAEIKPGDVVIEVGPGYGVLTEPLLSAGAKVFAIEKDFDLIAGLTQKFGNNKNLKIVHQDALFFDVDGMLASLRGANATKQSDSSLRAQAKQSNKDRHGHDNSLAMTYKVVANLPFNIASPIIRKFLESANPPELMVLMVQKEVAEKITAKPGNRERGILTLAVEFYGSSEIIADVPKTSFRPQPKVDAAIIKIEPFKPRTRFEGKQVESKLFFRIVKAGFSAKRQQIHNSLTATLRLPKDQVRDILLRSSINPTERAEDLTLEDWINLSKTFESTTGS